MPGAAGAAVQAMTAGGLRWAPALSPDKWLHRCCQLHAQLISVELIMQI